jgi:hypothetical protein
MAAPLRGHRLPEIPHGLCLPACVAQGSDAAQTIRFDKWSKVAACMCMWVCAAAAACVMWCGGGGWGAGLAEVGGVEGQLGQVRGHGGVLRLPQQRPRFPPRLHALQPRLRFVSWASASTLA